VVVGVDCWGCDGVCRLVSELFVVFVMVVGVDLVDLVVVEV